MNKNISDINDALFQEQTEAYCNKCKCTHPAKIYETDNKIHAGYDCPENGKNSFEVSSDAGMYKRIRKRCFVNVTKTSGGKKSSLMHIMPITDACNFNCAACSMNVKPRDNANYLSLDEIVKRAELIKADGAKIVNLFGGEPTLHPKLFEILDCLKPYNFNIGIVTNGLIVGENASFAHELKKRGLTRISIQFDSLHKETLKKFGRSHLQEKLQAINYSLNAGLQVGLNCLITDDNVNEIPEIIQFVASKPSNLFLLAFLSCAPIGHLAIGADKLIDREKIIKSIIGDYNGFSIGLDDFFPMPTYLPWQLEGHPECGASALFIKNNGRVLPLSHYIDLDKLMELAAKNRMSPGFVAKKIVPFVYLARCIHQGRRLKTLSLAWRYITRKGDIGMMNIGTSNYKSADFQDINKISRCTVTVQTSQGPIQGCLYFFRDETFSGSRLNEKMKDAI